VGRAQNIDPRDAAFELNLFARTVEHLTTGPELVLAGLSVRLRSGRLPLCRIPSAVALHKGLKFPVAYNTNERSRIDPTNAG
jgi:hypothetical protein